MKRKYLDDIGCKDRWDEWEYGGEYKDRLREEREEWGFDERETFSLDMTFYEWLYERLIVYREVGGKVVNLEFHKIEYEDKEYTQLEIIDKLIEDLKWALTCEDADWMDEEGYKRLMGIGEMWAKVIPAMWW